MKPRFFLLLSALMAVSSPASAQELKPEAYLQMAIFPVWEYDGHSCKNGSPSVDRPNTTAVLVAPGYLVAPSMPFLAVYMETPRRGRTARTEVCLFSKSAGKTIRAHIVDAKLIGREGQPGLVLLKADEPIKGTPVRIASDADEAAVGFRFPPVLDVGGNVLFDGEFSQPADCSTRYQLEHAVGGFISHVRGVICKKGVYENYLGTPLFTKGGLLAGMLTFEDDPTTPRGLDAGQIRNFVNSYFNSWGQHLEVRPKL